MKRTSITDRQEYLDMCKEASSDQKLFDVFRKNSEFTKVMEHVNTEIGLKYFKIILNQFSGFFKCVDKFEESDSYGGAAKDTYTLSFRFSPSTLRYIKIMTDLDMLIGSLDGMDIVEIGSGYGGQSKILFDVYNIKSYTYIDLEEVLFLAKKYISNFEINAELNFISYVDFVKHIKEKYDLIISNYAFSECEKNIQLEYINAVLNNSSNGYLLCNDISNMHNIDSLTKKELLASIKQNVVVEKEEPLTHPKNYLLYWKKETK